MSAKKVLVIGATGAMGQYVVPELAALGYEVDAVALDGGIRLFGNRTLCRLATGVHGLYIEGVKMSGNAVTELIYYDDTGLHAPFYNPATNETVVTTRSGSLVAQDIDGDGMVEIPSSLEEQ